MIMAARKTKSRPALPKSKRERSKTRTSELGEEAELSPAQARELENRIKDLEDRSRYMLVSNLGPGFVLYYNVSEDTYGWNEPAHATLFKRREAAQAIQHLLGDKDRVVQCVVNKRGQLVKRSLGLTARALSTRVSTKGARRAAGQSSKRKRPAPSRTRNQKPKTI
jgi:hypothetical protein